MNHDRLCRPDDTGYCICGELARRDARVQATERERIAQEIEDYQPEVGRSARLGLRIAAAIAREGVAE